MPGPTRSDGFDGQCDPGNGAFGRGKFGQRHLLKIHFPQLFFHGKGQIGFYFDLVFFCLGRDIGCVLGLMIQQGLGGPPLCWRRRRWRRIGPHQRRKRPHHVFQEFRVPPIQVERLGIQVQMLGPRHETGLQRVKKIIPLGKPGGLHGTNGVDDAFRPQWQARTSQRPGKMGDVFRKPPIACGNQRRHQAGAVSAIDLRSANPVYHSANAGRVARQLRSACRKSR